MGGAELGAGGSETEAAVGHRGCPVGQRQVLQVVGNHDGGGALFDGHLAQHQLGAGIDGAETTRRIQRLPRPPRVLVLTTYDTDADILPAIEAGATGYLLKDTDPAELIAAIHAAAAGDTVLAPSVATRLVSRVRAPGIMLTPRETQVLQMVADGLSNQGIAKELFITEATVKSHLVQVFTKLGVDSRTAATAAARQRGLIR